MAKNSKLVQPPMPLISAEGIPLCGNVNCNHSMNEHNRDGFGDASIQGSCTVCNCPGFLGA